MTAARALARFALLLAVASVLIFLLLRAVPGDPARVALGVTATDEAVAELSTTLGLDRPLIVQYFDWITGLLTGDFGGRWRAAPTSRRRWWNAPARRSRSRFWPWCCRWR